MKSFPGVDQATPLRLLENGKPKSMGLSGALAYHAEGRHVGVVLGFLLVKRILVALPTPPERRSIAIRSGHPGSGMEDAFEHLLRAVSENRYQRAAFTDGPIVPGAPGRFRFEATIDADSFQIDLRSGILDPALFQKPDPTDPDDARKRWERQAAAIVALLEAPTEALFDLRSLPSADALA